MLNCCEEEKRKEQVLLKGGRLSRHAGPRTQENTKSIHGIFSPYCVRICSTVWELNTLLDDEHSPNTGDHQEYYHLVKWPDAVLRHQIESGRRKLCLEHTLAAKEATIIDKKCLFLELSLSQWTYMKTNIYRSHAQGNQRLCNKGNSRDCEELRTRRRAIYL